jgi:hypothetical protein
MIVGTRFPAALAGRRERSPQVALDREAVTGW